ncbi:MAG: ABC transporter ATP-binding protein, partial [Oscillospiraceae bacterium]|nr:ABC transporter ATP-binding protein [Oscillospiraceae bacterium]
MLALDNITKVYLSGSEEVSALKGVSLRFRRSEFVSVLGPSGCGKTTLLNIIGGLDSYTSGDLRIEGKSTRQFRDRDWDAYRNRSIGFVFQSYNLIPHQSELANVELAMTISGVSRAKRRERAKEALRQVGLEDQMHKRPNQMSGGQMQRVAIARALVNDPEILLADEPTGALDSETSVQIMEILKEISADRLVIMVTHNPELADRYSSRIIRLLDGQILSDSDPYTQDEADEASESKKQKKPSMSFFTALSLSLNNLLTKKTRTILTAFAGSIGIIGIALILSLSTGIQNYIDQVQKDTLSSYPITIEAETVDFSGLITTFMSSGEHEEHENDAVYANPIMTSLMDSMQSVETSTNNLTAFKEYLEQADNPIRAQTSVVQYGYDIPFEVYTSDDDGALVHSDTGEVMSRLMRAMRGGSADASRTQSRGFGGMQPLWEEMLPGADGEIVSPILYDQYDLVCGAWPQAYDEVVLILNERNELSDLALFALGVKPQAQIDAMADDFVHERKLKKDAESWAYEDLLGRTYKLILPAEAYSTEEI